MEKPTKTELKIFSKVINWVKKEWMYDSGIKHCYNCVHTGICKNEIGDVGVEKKRLDGFIKAETCLYYKHKTHE